jgi:hypothetical protein
MSKQSRRSLWECTPQFLSSFSAIIGIEVGQMRVDRSSSPPPTTEGNTRMARNPNDTALTCRACGIESFESTGLKESIDTFHLQQFLSTPFEMKIKIITPLILITFYLLLFFFSPTMFFQNFNILISKLNGIDSI